VRRRQKLIKFNNYTRMAILSSPPRSLASLSCTKTPFSSSSFEDAFNYPPATAHSQYGACSGRSPMDLLQRCERVTALHCFYCGGSGRDIVEYTGYRRRLVVALTSGPCSLISLLSARLRIRLWAMKTPSSQSRQCTVVVVELADGPPPAPD
jgi:hypothetical protein